MLEEVVLLVATNVPPTLLALALLYHSYEAIVPETRYASAVRGEAPEQKVCADDDGFNVNTGSETLMVPVALTSPFPPVNGML